MKKILLTGASGFIGKALLPLLEQAGYSICAVSSKLHFTNSKMTACDLRNELDVRQLFERENPDIVIHLAALSSVTKGNTLDYYCSNVLATENIIKSIMLLGGKRRRFIFASTAGVYGNQNAEILHEDMCPAPVSHYGYSKLICERMLFSQMVDQHDVTVVRLFNLVGEGQSLDFIVPKLVKHFADRSAVIELGNIEPIRDYIDVEYAASVLTALLNQRDSYGQIVNLCSGDGYAVSDLLAMLISITGHDIKVISSSKFIRKKEVWRLLGSTSKLNTYFPDGANYKIPMEATLKQMLDYYRRRKES